MKDKITIIGSGAMGTAMSKVVHDSGYNNIFIYGIDKDEISDLNKGINTKYFPNHIKLPNVTATDEIDYALEDASYIILAVPSKIMDIVLENILSELTEAVILINVSKGFFPGTNVSLHEGIVDKTAENEFIRGVVSLAGPSHAEEIVSQMPTYLSLISKDKENLIEIQNLFNTDYLKTFMQSDVRGAEVGSSYKNALAIGAGILDGMGYGVNTSAAYLTRGLKEMISFNKAMKGKLSTITGLTGIGDLIVTATSPLSRNFKFGREFACLGLKSLKKNKETVEGLQAINYIHEISKNKKIETPIVDFIHDLINGKEKKENILKCLWNGKKIFE